MRRAAAALVAALAASALLLAGQAGTVEAHHGPNHKGGPPHSQTPTPTPTPTITPTPTPTPTPTEPPPVGACTAAVTIDAPVGGLGAAVIQARAENRAGRSVCLLLTPGALYRESVLLGSESGQTTAAITVDGRGATLSGADVYPWTSFGGGQYGTTWTHNLGDTTCPSDWPCSLIDPAIFGREALFVGESPYVVVDTEAELAPGTFWVSEATDRLYVYAKPGDEPITSAEITVRRPVVYVQGRSNVTVRNLTVQRGYGAVTEAQIRAANTTDLLLENIVTRQAAGIGVDICCSTRPTLRNVDARHNGIIGLGFGFNNVLRVEDTDNVENNWRGAHTGFIGWATDKFYENDDVTVLRWMATGNQSHGIWFDWGNERVLVEDAVLAGNVGRGAFIEANPGPITFRRATVCNNGFGGFAYARSNYVTVEDSTVFDNRRWQHYGTGQGAPFYVDSPPVLADGYNFTLRNTVTRASDLWPDGQGGWLYSLGTQDEAGWHSSNAFSGNQWFSSARSAPFQTAQGAMAYPQFAAYVGETGGAYADPGVLICPAPRHPNAQDQPNGW